MKWSSPWSQAKKALTHWRRQALGAKSSPTRPNPPQPARSEPPQAAGPRDPIEAALSQGFERGRRWWAGASGDWAPQLMQAYWSHLRALAKECPLKGDSREAAAKAMAGLSSACFEACAQLGGSGPGDPKRRSLAREQIKAMWALPAGSFEREGAAWALGIHFRSLDEAMSALGVKHLGGADWEGWLLLKNDWAQEFAQAARGIGWEAGEIWSGRWPILAQTAKNHEQEPVESSGLALIALELCARLGAHERWPGLGGRTPDPTLIAPHLAALERQWLGRSKKAWANGSKEDGDCIEAFATRWLEQGLPYCQMLGEALASCENGDWWALRLAAMLESTLGEAASSHGRGHWAGLEASLRPVSSSPWVVATLARAALKDPKVLAARDSLGRSVGGLLNAALKHATPEKGASPWDQARLNLASRWAREAVIEMLAKSPDGGRMLVPMCDFHAWAADEEIRLAAERAELSLSASDAPSRAASRL